MGRTFRFYQVNTTVLLLAFKLFSSCKLFSLFSKEYSRFYAIRSVQSRDFVYDKTLFHYQVRPRYVTRLNVTKILKAIVNRGEQLRNIEFAPMFFFLEPNVFADGFAF